ncbi:regulatory protein RecX [Candidatus Ruthia endofausta]|uniref:Regulatory protein RecX n=1 Tax=Candidatus Ruthia endofausta TaxID=2738852 RepID=A0A6N0HR05_9GAMM|nr:regulatory protein RecX [Candidatus Ruthia endofausta]
MKTSINQAYHQILSLLVQREYSALELTQKLSTKGYAIEEIEPVLVQLAQNNYQSDERFSKAFVLMRTNQGKGDVLISQQLKQKGIEDFDLSTIDFFELAKRVRLKKYGEQLPKDYKEKAKQQRFLQSRGFDLEQINQVFSCE